MKRSEMLKVLRDELSKYKHFVSQGNDWELNLFPNKLLIEIEKAGMLPPMAHLTDDDGPPMRTKDLLNEANLDYTLGWEDEDGV